MDIYIKSFNRPYLLHRTIASIYQYLEGFDSQIVVLDDGTPQKYLDKIQQLFPKVNIKKSPYYQQKSNDLLLNKIPPKLIPANFWRDEVLKGSEYFILLEDDMWFTTLINYTNFTADVYENKMDMVKFIWLKNKQLISNRIIKRTKHFNIVSPKVLTKNRCIFDTVFKTNRLMLGSLIMKFVNHEKELLKYYHLYIVAGGVFSKRYYETAWRTSKDKVDELLQIKELLNFKNKLNVGNTAVEVIKATYKFTASSIHKDKFYEEFDVYKFNSILNMMWYNDEIYDVFDFNNDISNDWIKHCFKEYPDKYYIWKKWYNDFKKSYENFGCSIS